MALTVYNTATRKKERFTPIDPEHIKMYVCGPTVYNLIHIGNARPVVAFDVLFRILQSEYPQVTYARNITDIDDKIMKAAAENDEAISTLAARYAAEYAADTAALGALEPSIVPYATEHVAEMISMVERLVEQGHAYAAEGHVLFSVQSMDDYGKLSNRSLEDMLDGARVEVAPYKKYAGDFVLWKPSSSGEPGWESPWGYGRPGWHLECSAMIEAHLGETIDIHGGGRDLIFPHHENEVAQSVCAHGGKEYVRYWLHNGYVNIAGEKMSKSLGNFRTVRELLKEYRGEVIRFALLSAQYRSELDFSAELLDQSRASLDSLYGFLRDNADVTADTEIDIKSTPIYQALLDDLNTPIAISKLYTLSKSLAGASDDKRVEIKSTILKAGWLMGILQQDPDHWFQQSDALSSAETLTPEQIEALIQDRQQAKLDKNYSKADEIRQGLEKKGVLLEDSREGTKWKRA